MVVPWCMLSGVTLAMASNSPQARASSSEVKPFPISWVAWNFARTSGRTSTAPTTDTPGTAAKWMTWFLAMLPVPSTTSRMF